MAGWLKRVDGSFTESFKARLNRGEANSCSDQESFLEGALASREEEEGNDCNSENLKSLFDAFLAVFFEAFFGGWCLRPLPPVLGDGQFVDLFRLYLLVSERGGFEKVSENRQWGCLARECGFGAIVGSSLKLIYVKYLGGLNRYLERVSKVRDPKGGTEQSGSGFLCGFLMELEPDLRGRFSGNSHKNEKKGGLVNVDVQFKEELGFGLDGKLPRFDEHADFLKLNGNAEILERMRFVQEGGKGRNENAFRGKPNAVDEGRGFVVDNSQVQRTNDADTVLDSRVGTEDVHSRKRKPGHSYKMLDWIASAAMDPCNPEIGTLPDSSKWRYYADDLMWKQVLLARQEMLLKVSKETVDQPETLQKKQKMHPTLYDDLSEGQRFSQRIRAAKDTSRRSRARLSFDTSSSGIWSDEDLFESQSDSSGDLDTNFVGSLRRREKRVPIGSNFQADIPEWTGKTSESDSRWLGTRFWPLEKAEQNRNLIERERIGKGRQDSCGCQYPGSLECIRFHISERRIRIKLELGPAFFRMRFNNMGEGIVVSWTKEEQKKFRHIVESNPLSLGKLFWRELVKSFASRDTEELVSYYYNVFLLQRRGQQNRITPHDINSDDDESGASSKAAISPGSIFCSPKKSFGKAG